MAHLVICWYVDNGILLSCLLWCCVYPHTCHQSLESNQEMATWRQVYGAKVAYTHWQSDSLSPLRDLLLITSFISPTNTSICLTLFYYSAVASVHQQVMGASKVGGHH